ncbi:uncharacterized protein BO97DRAFT_446543 [Aspergillus homomorphus CBS 101889]|uniref:Uncharacterized protein n=1 Tax=Aspergillus homomorphus (strain CBS 101889) TaxID=1450537 RepID=A0A395HNM3_ASPHC|nr:hypothetical protein BO97DRAFT_446543 [Aspergillus homomorphus CBS 101889]RAL07874.1 hypothetical protein BO97DRAFT_446543 [Aspergillus homomorphus CBS 101889]
MTSTEAPHLLRYASRLTSSTTTINPRLPPIARHTTSTTTSSASTSTIIPTHIVLLSRNKLQRETATKSPDLRRCLAHQRLLHRSIQAAQQAVRAQLAAATLEDEDAIDEEEEYEDQYSTPSSSPSETAPVTVIREQITGAVKAMVRRRAASASASTSPYSRELGSSAEGMKRGSSQQNLPLLGATNGSEGVSAVPGDNHGFSGSGTGESARVVVLRKTKRYTSRIVFGRRRWPLYGLGHGHGPPALVS